MREEREISKLLSTLKDTSQPDKVRQWALEQLMLREEETQAQLSKDFTAKLPDSDALQQESDNAYDGLKLKLQIAGKAPVNTVRSPAPIVMFRKWASIAVAVLVVIGSAWLLQYYAKTPTGTASLTALLPGTSNNRFDTIWNTGSSTSFHRLQDQSTVHLEAGSKIIFRDTFPTGNKEIFLQGSALFTVNRDMNRPFSVIVSGIEVLDLGTVFSVMTNKSIVKVRLIQGKVLIRSVSPQLSIKEIRLVPGEEFKIDTVTQQYSVNRVVPHGALHNSKLNKMLSFQNASLQEVFNSIEKECRVTIHSDKTEIKDKAFTGTFDAGSNARDMIATICLINDLKYELQNDHLYIHN